VNRKFARCPISAQGESETPNQVSDGGSFRRNRPWYLTGMSTRLRSQAGPPMTLGNMRANGVRSLAVSCHLCHHEAVVSAEPVARSRASASVRPAHGVHRVRHHRCRRAAELAGATGAGEPDRRAMASLKSTSHSQVNSCSTPFLCFVFLPSIWLPLSECHQPASCFLRPQESRLDSRWVLGSSERRCRRGRS
jgi:hypothetical protein